METVLPEHAIVGLQVDAEQFRRPETVNYHIRGRIIRRQTMTRKTHVQWYLGRQSETAWHTATTRPGACGTC
ncbi:hypothetical protein [Escherichia coli]|uniref:hypothetical protein n=1 Tax=Escherichia coli TaxID=562 RepID=UPI003890839F